MHGGMGVTLIPPPSDALPLAIFARLHKVLQSRSTKVFLDNAISSGDESVREIQAGRYELFVEARTKPCTAFDHITRNLLEPKMKEILLQYAKAQAMKDPRLRNANSGKTEYNFGNFSLLINFEPCQAQEPHIDLLLPNWQFGLVLTDNAPGTRFAESCAHIRTATDLKKWCDATIPNASTKSLWEAIRRNTKACKLIENFGDVLASDVPIQDLPRVRAGSVLSLPGSVVHAGPRSSGFRAVLFFSACPRSASQMEYHPDTQYTSVLLWSHITSLLWRQKGVTFTERRALLLILSHYVDLQQVQTMHTHCREGPLASLLQCLETKKFPKKQTHDSLIEASARDEYFCAVTDPFASALKGLCQISVDNLFTSFGGSCIPLTVYREMEDGKILLYYPDEGSWEGHDESDNYTLRVTNGHRFDGCNGQLFGNDGVEIKCFTRREDDAESTTDLSVNRAEAFDDGNGSSNCNPDDQWATFEDIRKLQVDRSWVVTNYDRPSFENVVKLRFVRYALTTKGTSIYRIGEVKRVVELGAAYEFQNIKDFNKRLRISYPDYHAMKFVKDIRLSQVSNKPFTESEYNYWVASRAESLTQAREDGASHAALRPFRRWTKRRVDNRLRRFDIEIAQAYEANATLFRSPPSHSPPSVASATLWTPIKRAHEEIVTSRPVARVLAINGIATSFSRDFHEKEKSGAPPMLKRKRKEKVIPQPEVVDDHDNAESITTTANVIADMATSSSSDTATKHDTSIVMKAPMFIPEREEIATCIAINGIPTSCSTTSCSNNSTKAKYTAGEPPMLKQVHKVDAEQISKRRRKEIVVAYPVGDDDVISHPEGVGAPKYVGGTTSVSRLKSFQQSTQCTKGILTKAKIDKNEANGPRDLLKSMVTPLEDMRHTLESLVKRTKHVIGHLKGTDDVIDHPKGTAKRNYDVIGYAEGGVDDPEYAGRTTPLSVLKNFQQITQQTNNLLKEAKIRSNEANGPRDLLESMVTPLEDMRHTLKSLVNRTKDTLIQTDATTKTKHGGGGPFAYQTNTWCAQQHFTQTDVHKRLLRPGEWFHSQHHETMQSKAKVQDLKKQVSKIWERTK